MGNELDVFVGSWKTSGLLWADPDQEPVEFLARDIYEWFPGGHFLLHHVEANMAGTEVRALEICRYDPERADWVLESYDNSGGHVIFRARLSGDDWRIDGDTERFAGTFIDGGQRISGRWERRTGTDWVHWLDVTLTKEN